MGLLGHMGAQGLHHTPLMWMLGWGVTTTDGVLLVLTDVAARWQPPLCQPVSSAPCCCVCMWPCTRAAQELDHDCSGVHQQKTAQPVGNIL